MFISRALISIVPCLSFVKFEEGLPLEKFSLPPLPWVVNRLKRKKGTSSRVQTPSKGKSQDVESSTTSSSLAHNIPNKSLSNGCVTKTSTSA